MKFTWLIRWPAHFFATAASMRAAMSIVGLPGADRVEQVDLLRGEQAGAEVDPRRSGGPGRSRRRTAW